MSTLVSLQPQALWGHFQRICNTPHPSRHEEALIRQIEQFAAEQGLAHRRDRAGNLILRKAATPGREDAPGIVLQSHLDMVPQKSDQSTHDFASDPIRPRVVDGWVLATDTTLGADNGIGVAAILALMESRDIEHGPLEALLTVNEEAGMDGAMGLEPGILSGTILLNLDSEQEGELYVGCAGGIDASATLPVAREPNGSNASAIQITVQGLHGGHSGIDIHLGRGNANRILAELIRDAGPAAPRIAEFEGGSLRNAIARHAEAVLAVTADQQPTLLAQYQAAAQQLEATWREQEPGLQIHVQTGVLATAPLTTESTDRLLQAILDCPHGVYRMDPNLDGVVETSNNLARVTLAEDRAELLCLARSARETARDELCAQIRQRLETLGATLTFDGAYPGWTPDPDSLVLAALNQLHTECYGKPAEIRVIHAGLECGLLAAAYPHWDMISFGPTIRYPHSPSEKVEIASVARFWDYLCAGVERLSRSASVA